MNIARLLPALVEHGHDVAALVFHQGCATPNADQLQRYGVRVFRHTWHSTTQSKIHWILRILRKLKTDIFVPNISAVGWYAAKWVRSANIPTIATYRSDDAFHAALVDKFVCGDPEWAVSGLVCVSEELARRVVSRQPASTEVCVIPSGVPINNGGKASHQSPLRIAYVGRMQNEQKQITETFNALVECLKQGIQFANVTFFGDGPQRSELEHKTSQLGLNDIFFFAGRIASEQVQEKLNSFQVLVLLSDYEGMPGAVMEAMACGVVPICTRLPGLEELVIDGKTGFLVDDRAESFQRAVISLTNNQALWQSMSDCAVEHVRNGYSLDVCTRRWEQFAERLLQHAGPRRSIPLPRRLELPGPHPDFAREDIRTRHPRLYLNRAFDIWLSLKRRLNVSHLVN